VARERAMKSSRQSSAIRGSLLGGAVGDALGAGIEFSSLAQIRGRFGPRGVADYVEAYGRRGAITDDTQMTLFTAEGLIRAAVRLETKGICHPPSVVHHAYLRWLLQQGEAPPIETSTDGWLYDALHQQGPRAPGLTCLAALRAAESFGAPAVARNNSKGCGGVMRVAPVGLFAGRLNGDAAVFRLASEVAALTHGHATGHLAAGYFAVLIAALLDGFPLFGALERADAALAVYPQGEEVKAAVAAARALASRGPPDPEALATLGRGWVADEALAIAVACALTAEDFAAGILRAVNHSGDSDSTGALAGNILGVMLGEEAIPEPWLNQLEVREVIARIAGDLADIVTGARTAEDLWTDYPGA